MPINTSFVLLLTRTLGVSGLSMQRGQHRSGGGECRGVSSNLGLASSRVRTESPELMAAASAVRVSTGRSSGGAGPPFRNPH